MSVRRIIATVSIALTALLVAGCTGTTSGSSASMDDAAAGGAVEAPPVGGAEDAAGDGSGAKAGAPDGGVVQRDIVRVASLSVEVTDVDGGADAIAAMVTGLSGRVDGDARLSADDRRTATLVIRVPPKALDALIEQVAALGSETSRKVSGEDVTTIKADIDARVASLQASVARLQKLLSTSASLTQLLELENALTQRISELESMLAQQKSLGDQVSLATLTVSLSAPDAVVASSGPTGFGSAVADGWTGLLVAARWVLAVVGYALPFLALLAAAGVAALVLVKRRRTPAETTPTAAV